MKVPFVDLHRTNNTFEVIEMINPFIEVLHKGNFIGGDLVKNFEHNFAIYNKSSYCVGVNSGTDALRFALMAANCKDKVVITVPNSFIATVEAIVQAGGIPEFIDIDPTTYTMDPNELVKFIAEKCVILDDGRLVSKKWGKFVHSVLPVHLYGHSADVEAILKIIEPHRLFLIEDACQAHGSVFYSKIRNRWMPVGTTGYAAAFSFYPSKNLGAFGEGGAIVTDSPEAYRLSKSYRDHGQTEKYVHDTYGYNGRLDALQAGILDVKLRHLDHFVEERRMIATHYTNHYLYGIQHIKCPEEKEWCKSSYHLYVIQAEKRDELQAFLLNKGISTGLHYPIPLHLQKACKDLEYIKGEFPVTENVAERLLSLPLYPGLTIDQQAYVADAIREF